ncbi:MAG: hypothetical protein AW08_00240 [Candidatus Accumulibacter adjunctus]|uniref:Uncharacterized protein n=1 Tax=Candidatus Accumulibacter adjunctus TaxID=1454001 RepID=A0A011NYM1_9PROT|nr:MAG: hypothetical protein AW08_00240 [Candidatus Accumulibacter adjunctus]
MARPMCHRGLRTARRSASALLTDPACPDGGGLRGLQKAVSTVVDRVGGGPGQAGRLKNGAVSNTGVAKPWPSFFRLRLSTKS